nr:auxin-responsive protein SAUR32-like [Ipomoea batatas]GMD53694.1 auxin-responsive protein SAUR32-like [Ipomoea batatas]GME21480.1 auxin-responsive protein SAUR32-like [Ipomoea batatas]
MKGGGVAKGSVAIMVGGKGEEQQRFVIPVNYINHPLFFQLLKEAEEVYGFHHRGPINIPCHAEEFRHVRKLIHQDHQNHSTWCFKIRAAAVSTLKFLVYLKINLGGMVLMVGGCVLMNQAPDMAKLLHITGDIDRTTVVEAVDFFSFCEQLKE